MAKILKIIILLFSLNTLADTSLDPKVLEKVKKSVVNIETRVSSSAYGAPSQGYGTGFIVDLKNKLIVTNRHVMAGPSICTYSVHFYNGQIAEAKVMYYDIYRDYAILKVSELPLDAQQIPISNQSPKEGQFLFIVGNNQGQGFSFHAGYLSNLYYIENGTLPQHSYIFNSNTKGGSSGSPVLTADGSCIALNYAVSDTYSIALHIGYITQALDSIKSEQEIKRKSAGVIYELVPIDKLVRHRNFPKELANEYIKKYPDSRNRILGVKSIIGSKATQDNLAPGDIIIEVDGQNIGPDLYKLEQIIDNSKDNNVKFTIIRNGAKRDEIVKIYEVNKNKIKKLLDFGGAIFFDSDDASSYISGIPIGKLALFNVRSGSSFSTIKQAFYSDDRRFYRVIIQAINDYKINNLDELIKIMPKIMNEKHLKVEYKNYMPYMVYNYQYSSAHEKLVEDIEMDAANMAPQLFIFDEQNHEWKKDTKAFNN